MTRFTRTSVLTPVLIAVVALMLLAPTPGQAQFIKFEGVDGESMDRGHEGWIEVHSFAWGATRSATPPTAGRGELVFQRRADRSSPKLAEAIARGKAFPSVSVRIRDASARGGAAYLEITLRDVVISSYQTGGGDGVANMERVTLTYERIERD